MSTQPPLPSIPPELFSTAPPVIAGPRATPGKVMAPAIALLCVAGFNGLYTLSQFKELILGRSRAEQEQLEKIVNDENAPELMRNAVRRIIDGTPGKWFAALISLLFSIGIAGGGIATLRMQMFPLALAGAVMSVIPCATIMGCCGVGQGVGIWAIVVLANPEVRSWFR